jgi:hypothetical protein
MQNLRERIVTSASWIELQSKPAAKGNPSDDSRRIERSVWFYPLCSIVNIREHRDDEQWGNDGGSDQLMPRGTVWVEHDICRLLKDRLGHCGLSSLGLHAS